MTEVRGLYELQEQIFALPLSYRRIQRLTGFEPASFRWKRMYAPNVGAQTLTNTLPHTAHCVKRNLIPYLVSLIPAEIRATA